MLISPIDFKVNVIVNFVDVIRFALIKVISCYRLKIVLKISVGVIMLVVVGLIIVINCFGQLMMDNIVWTISLLMLSYIF